MLAFPLMSIGLALGLALIAATRRAGLQALSWTDPKVLSGAALWAVFAILVHARLRPAMRGRRVAILTIVAFGFLLFLWIGVGLLVPTDHGLPPGLRGRP
jgi:ABC-type transport system involved in cytochrome c biogenesis permease subunit